MLIHIFHLPESFPNDIKSFHVIGLFQAGSQLGVVGDTTVATQDTASSSGPPNRSSIMSTEIGEALIFVMSMR